MRITEVSYRENNLGDRDSKFKSRSLEATSAVGKGESPAQVMTQLKEWVQGQLGIKPELSLIERQTLACLSNEPCAGRLYKGKPSDVQRGLATRGLITITYQCGKGTFEVTVTEKGQGAL